MKKSRNCGSAVIEISMLMPVFLGCVYLYILLFLFFIESGKQMEKLADCIYVTETESAVDKEYVSDIIQVRKEGNVRIAQIRKQGVLFSIRLELQKDENNPVENIRRWQLASDAF